MYNALEQTYIYIYDTLGQTCMYDTLGQMYMYDVLGQMYMYDALGQTYMYDVQLDSVRYLMHALHTQIKLCGH